MVDDCASHPEWQRKIEEDIGGCMAFMVVSMDESARDSLVELSPLFARFVLLLPCLILYRIKKNKNSSNEKRKN